MLTVWRKLHVEFDSMTAPAANDLYITGKFLGVLSNPPGPGRSWVMVRHTAAERVKDLFQRGKIQVSGFNTYRITNSAMAFQSGSGFDDVTILDVEQFPPNVPKYTPVFLYDDDERFLQNDSLYPSKGNQPSPPLPANTRSDEFVTGMQFRFDPAYIRLINANALGWNTQSNINFKLNERALGAFGVSYFDQGNLDLKGKDTPNFWCFSVVFGYQPDAPQDGDGKEEVPLTGGSPYNLVTKEPFGYSVVYLEAIRDLAFGVGRDKSDTDLGEFNSATWGPFHQARLTNWVYGVIAHELGHAPGRQGETADHTEAGLMQEGASPIDDQQSGVFTPKTILRFRSRPSWTD